MAKLQNIYRVVANEKLCPRFYRLSFDAPAVVRKIRPGQFVHIRTREGLEPFFRRPFSVCRARRYVEILYEIVGAATEILSLKKRGDLLDVLGPVGTPFVLPPSGIKQVVMIGGGVGVAPFLILSDVLKKKKSLKLVLLYGGRTGGHVFNMKDFKHNGCRVHVATDDGSVGVHGRVEKLFDRINPDPESTFLYTCGPKPMMAAVQRFAREHGLKGQAACEAVMACALGACLGCSIRTQKGFRTVCYDGPAFDLREVIFD